MRLDSIAVAPGLYRAVGLPDGGGLAGAGNASAGRDAAHLVLLPAARPLVESLAPMTIRHPERLGSEQRLLNSRQFTAVQTGGTLFRGRCALLIVLPRPGEPSRVGFVASKKGVGGAVQRNRARRRLREIVRRRWARVAGRGWWMVFIAGRAVLDAPHERLAAEVESLLASAGLLAAAAEAEH